MNTRRVLGSGLILSEQSHFSQTMSAAGTPRLQPVKFYYCLVIVPPGYFFLILKKKRKKKIGFIYEENHKFSADDKM